MESYLQKGLPTEYQSMMQSFVNISSPSNVMNYVGQIGDDWSNSTPRHHPKPTVKSSQSTQIQLIIVDEENEDDRQTFDIGSSTTLKTLFNDYAEKRSVSLRSLRFSYQGKTLFLSSVGNKTPDECNMRDQDVIVVHDTSASQEPSNSPDQTNKKSSLAKKAKSSKKCKGKCKKKKQDKPYEEPSMTLEEFKTQHSQLLSKLHEEVEAKLKEIRTRLNALDLERQAPKQKKKKSVKKKKKAQVEDLEMLPSSCVGGKAGKPVSTKQNKTCTCLCYSAWSD